MWNRRMSSQPKMVESVARGTEPDAGDEHLFQVPSECFGRLSFFCCRAPTENAISRPFPQRFHRFVSIL